MLRVCDCLGLTKVLPCVDVPNDPVNCNCTSFVVSASSIRDRLLAVASPAAGWLNAPLLQMRKLFGNSVLVLSEGNAIQCSRWAYE